MTNRLPYSTTGGQVSESDTFAQMLEYLRMAEECAYTIGHLRKANDDELTGQGWLAVGEMLKLTQHSVTKLATGALGIKGWRQ
jgi:predicted nucleotide-binding protein (sugar kinase/HSP70/actin superfamily)